jgi:hypothetical protein
MWSQKQPIFTFSALIFNGIKNFIEFICFFVEINYIFVWLKLNYVFPLLRQILKHLSN